MKCIWHLIHIINSQSVNREKRPSVVITEVKSQGLLWGCLLTDDTMFSPLRIFTHVLILHDWFSSWAVVKCNKKLGDRRLIAVGVADLVQSKLIPCDVQHVWPPYVCVEFGNNTWTWHVNCKPCMLPLQKVQKKCQNDEGHRTCCWFCILPEFMLFVFSHVVLSFFVVANAYVSV